MHRCQFLLFALLSLLFYRANGECSCPEGTSCCNEQCYNRNEHECLSDGSNTMLCPLRHSLCGQSCYDPATYLCCNQQLCQLNDPLCACPSSSQSPESSPSTLPTANSTAIWHESSHSDWIYGVNIGGWLVIEPFITPSLFRDPRVKDEWTMGLYYNTSGILQRHWDTWVSFNDLANLRDAGVTHLRVPIGYWIVMTEAELEQYGEPFIAGGWTYFLRLLRWSKTLGLKVVIDLHAAPGHQNPWPHSGRVNHATWGTGDSINRTLETLSRVSQRILATESDDETRGVVIGLEILNEPFPVVIPGGLQTIKEFYITAYHVVRRYLPASRYMILIDWAFSPDSWLGFMSDRNVYQNVVLDVHIYQCFDPGMNQASFEAHITFACSVGKQQVRQQTLPSVVGEWSLCFKEPSDTAATEPFPTEREQRFLYSYFLAQINAFSVGKSRGWYFWNFKTESAAMWDYLLGLSHNWIPQLPTNYQSACN